MSMNKSSMGLKIYDAMGLEQIFDDAGLGTEDKQKSKDEMIKMADGIIKGVVEATISVGLQVDTETKTVRVKTGDSGFPDFTPIYEDQEITYVINVSVNTTDIS